MPRVWRHGRYRLRARLSGAGQQRSRDRIRAAGGRRTGGPERAIGNFHRIAGSEDFAYFLQQRPGCFVRMGNGANQPLLHNAGYDFNDDNLTVGAAYWTRLVERYLPGGRAGSCHLKNALGGTPNCRRNIVAKALGLS
jgi:metal-dependent amidase/aminoacylase/carboxypeptidase family protein